MSDTLEAESDEINDKIMALESLHPDLICGQILSDDPVSNKLNCKSMLLETSRRIDKRYKLDFSKCGSPFSLRNASIVAIEGEEIDDVIYATNVLFEAEPAMPTSSIDRVATEPFEIVFGCGPYTARSDLDYVGLESLVVKVVETKPSVVVLMGPFVDITHPLISRINESLEEFFKQEISSRLDRIIAKGVKVK